MTSIDGHLFNKHTDPTTEAVNKMEETTPGSFKFLFLLNIFLEKYTVKA